MTLNLRGKTALVTGAGSGIGRAIALSLAGSDIFVFVNYLSNETGAKETLRLIEEAGGSGQLLAADVSQADQVESIIKEIDSQIGRLDILVNNAGGLVKREKIENMSEKLWDEVMNINVKSTFLCCRAALPLMKGRGWGRIINLSSLAAHDGGGNGAIAYAAAKAAIQTFTKGLAKEVASEGITVNCVAPGLISTAFHDVFSTPQARQNMVNNTPLKREGTAGEVGEVVLFLASDMASFITGETVNINGGQRMC